MKKIVSLLLVAVIFLIFAGCGVCSTCNNEMYVKCSNCYEGKVDCENCHMGLIDPVGCDECDGEKYELVDCSQCGGSGKIVNPFTWEKFQCSSCDGKMYEYDYCDMCDGEGVLGTDCEECFDGTVKCEICQGEYTKDCPDCE